MTNQKTPLRGRQGADQGPVPGRVAGPGQLDVGDVAAARATGESLAGLAKLYGLRPSARRPPVPEYLAQLWQRRHFIMAFATARNIALYTEARLGQLWQVLTPLLNAGVYFLVFGELLGINRGIPNYLGFVVTGVFVFNFTQRSFISTSSVMQDNIDLIRALQFPRAALPLGYVVIELQQMALSLVVLVPILLATGEPLSWYWLLALPALALQSLFNVGCGLLVARMSAHVNDVSQLLPFLTRTWLYVSGVIFSISTLTVSGAAKAVLEINPAALYITLIRNALMASQRDSAPGSKPYNAALCKTWHQLGAVRGAPTRYLYDSAYCHAIVNPAHLWYYAAGWAVLALVVGFFFFWRAETGYGRG
ncbi:MAG TPA: ABC transporter permease [Streptosporangiaceae bacterium]|nr:ABC transporter permease [Streptosporangiaceae bacterium]